MDPIGGNFYLKFKWLLNSIQFIRINFKAFFSIIESLKYFEVDGFVYKKVNENGTTVYLDCLNQPNCLVAARFYKKEKQFRLLGNHDVDICPPDDKMKTKIHFEEFLKKHVLEKGNAEVSVLNIYKRVVEDRYKGLWLPENHRQNFLVVLRRIRNSKKNIDGKLKLVKNDELKKCDVATSPIVDLSSTETNTLAQLVSPLSESNVKVATTLMQSLNLNEKVSHNNVSGLT